MPWFLDHGIIYLGVPSKYHTNLSKRMILSQVNCSSRSIKMCQPIHADVSIRNGEVLGVASVDLLDWFAWESNHVSQHQMILHLNRNFLSTGNRNSGFVSWHRWKIHMLCFWKRSTLKIHKTLLVLILNYILSKLFDIWN